MKTLITILTVTVTIASLVAACNSDKIANVVIKAKSTNQIMRQHNCIDDDGTYLATDHCMSVLYPERGEF